MRYTCPKCSETRQLSLIETCEPGESMKVVITGHSSPPYAKDVAELIATATKSLEEIAKSCGQHARVYVESVTTVDNTTTIGLVLCPVQQPQQGDQ